MQTARPRQLRGQKSLCWEPHRTRDEELRPVGHFLEYNHALVLNAKEKGQIVGFKDVNRLKAIISCDKLDS